MRTLSVLLVLLLFAASAFAEKAATRTCRILFLEAPASAPKKLFLFDGATSQEVELPSMNFSPAYEIAGGRTGVSLLPAPVAKPEEIPAGAPMVAIPESFSDCYLILSSDPANKIAPVRIQLVDASVGKFKNGQMLWFNLTKNMIVGQIGTRALRLSPSAKKITGAPASSASSYAAKIGYVIPGEKTVRPIFETQWQHNPRTRMVMFIFEQTPNAAPRVMGFSDFRLKEKDASQP
ncbi:MAG: hypothetical protein NWT08_13705 [Akkermansiaceae bacterium]|jgi:hypothetical protein|nr:hypothetical protein [Akkermansiaceae bacterium]MDP4646049.1 hypothetical protein [Akkermansiaceae bacterium]MDP4780793.1 hypothetical protein [Akkermansiaceae bacterium]MDP4847872.1 hypothetical protein [Akkermansiaceae bacterium]MDP4898202.1 hypothetical protein [Akkermansiaceae bacterium]